MIYLLLYVILTSLSCVIIKLFAMAYSGDSLLLLSVFYAIIFFHILNFREIVVVYKILMQKKILYFTLMLSIAIIWGLTFAGSIFISPTFLSFVIMLIGVVFAMVFEYKKSTTKLNLFSLLLVVGLFILFMIHLYGSYNGSSFGLMLIMFILIGGADYVYASSCYAILKDKKLSVTQVLAARFWLLLIVSCGYMAYDVKSMLVIKNINFMLIGSSFMVALVSFIIPIFLYQKAIHKVGVNLSMTISGVIPLMTFLFEKYIINDSVYTNSSLLYFAIALFLIVCFSKISVLWISTKVVVRKLKRIIFNSVS